MDNLDLGCALIKKAVIDKALEEVYQDNIILDALSKRRQAKEKNIAYRDENFLKSIEFLPEALRPSPNGL